MGPLEQYLTENQERFYRVALFYLHDREGALDTVQDAVLRAMLHADELRNPARVSAWFYRILLNECRRYAREYARLHRRELPEEWMPPEGGCAQAFEEQTARRLDVCRAVSRLKPAWRTVVVLRFFEDMPLEDIARATGCPLGTVKTRLYRALAVLRSELGDEAAREGGGGHAEKARR